MKKVTYLLLLICFSSHAQLLIKFSGDSTNIYSYGGGDEFNGNVLNESDWTNGLGWGRIIMEQDLAFSPRNVVISDGMVDLVAKKEDSSYVMSPGEIDSAFLKKNKMQLVNNTFTTKYSVGCIVSKKKYHYGIYEIRFKVEEGRGVWPAYWFYGGKKNEEIDVFELKCENNSHLHVDTHCPYGCDRGYKNKLGINTNWGGWMPLDKTMNAGFNIMMLDWKPEELIWYINGYPVAYFKGTFANPMNVFLNTSVAKTGGAFSPGPDESSKWPNHFYVDYFRAWYPVPTSSDLVLRPGKEFALSGKFSSDYDPQPVKKSGLMYKKKKMKDAEGMISITLNGNKLTVTPMGKMKLLKGGVKVRTSKGEIKMENPGKENLIDLDPSEKEIEIIVGREKQEWRKKILILR